MDFSLPMLDIEAGAVGVIEAPGPLGEQPFEIACRGTFTLPIHWRVMHLDGLIKIDFRFDDWLEGTTTYRPRAADAGKIVAQWGRPELIIDLRYVPRPE